MANRLSRYLEDSFLSELYAAVRAAGPLKSISVDLTHLCNIRCRGCYFFHEGMDQHVPPDDGAFERFIEREKGRGTNFVTVVGGEPSLALARLKIIYRNFWMSVATNGLRRIPYAGFEELPIGVSVWGSPTTDRSLRGGGRLDIFQRALANYRDDPRAFWYYTVAPGHAHEVERVVEACVNNGNRVLFNFYSDLSSSRSSGDDRGPTPRFDAVREAIERAIDRYPERILMTSYFARVISEGKLYDETWGHEVCTSVSPDHVCNTERIQNGKPYNRHFRAYNADFQTTRRCCTGVDRDCASCFDTWEHFSWVMLNMKKHLASKREFTNWLTTMYLFYFINGIVETDESHRILVEIHERTRWIRWN